jgi:hypothetical protein
MKKSFVSAVLPALLVCIVLVQVLPQVDLPDAAFHSNTAPIIGKARVRAASTALKNNVFNLSVVDSRAPEVNREQFLTRAVPVKKFLPILLCCLLC